MVTHKHTHHTHTHTHTRLLSMHAQLPRPHRSSALSFVCLCVRVCVCVCVCAHVPLTRVSGTQCPQCTEQCLLAVPQSPWQLTEQCLTQPAHTVTGENRTANLGASGHQGMRHVHTNFTAFQTHKRAHCICVGAAWSGGTSAYGASVCMRVCVCTHIPL